MKKSKRLLLLSLCAFSLIGFTACGQKGDSTTRREDQTNVPQVFTVTFETNEGTAIASVQCDRSMKLSTILNGKTTTREGKVFTGWYADELLQTQVSLNAYIYSGMTLYAGWRDYTDAEILENAAMYAYEHAVAIKDQGYVRTGASTNDVHSVDAVVTLHHGEVTSGSRSHGTKYARYYDGEYFYTTIDGEETKLAVTGENEAIPFLYHHDIFKSLGFFSSFSPLAITRLAGSSYCTLTKEENTYTLTYNDNRYSGVALNWSEQNDPWVYFDAGRTFTFTLNDGKITKVVQSGAIGQGSTGRTLDLYYHSDEVVVPMVDNKDTYVQKWQLRVNTGGSTRIMYKEKINKQELDDEIWGENYTPQTSKLTYYWDKEKTQAIAFENGIVPLTNHTEIYHPDIDWDNITVARFEYSYGQVTLGYVSEKEENGIMTTTLRVKEGMREEYPYTLSIQPQPTNAKNKTVKVSFVSTPTTTDDYSNAITLDEKTYYTSLELRLPVVGEYVLKVETLDGTAMQYLRILPN